MFRVTGLVGDGQLEKSSPVRTYDGSFEGRLCMAIRLLKTRSKWYVYVDVCFRIKASQIQFSFSEQDI